MRFLIAQKDNKNCLTCLFIDPKTHQPRSTGSPRPMPKRPRSSVVQTLAIRQGVARWRSWMILSANSLEWIYSPESNIIPCKVMLGRRFSFLKWAVLLGNSQMVYLQPKMWKIKLLGPLFWLSHRSEKYARQNGLTFPN